MSDGIDIPLSYSHITDRLILGSRPRDAADIQTLLGLSVSHVLNVCATADPEWPIPVDYCWNQALDDGQSKPVDWFQRSLRFAMRLFAQPGWVLYVHCFNGIDRSGVTVYAILRAFGFSRYQAWFIIKERRLLALERYTDDADAALVKGW